MEDYIVTSKKWISTRMYQFILIVESTEELWNHTEEPTVEAEFLKLLYDDTLESMFFANLHHEILDNNLYGRLTEDIQKIKFTLLSNAIYMRARGVRYTTDSFFKEARPKVSEIIFKELREMKMSSPLRKQGYVYLLISEHGTKIGKTVRLRDRTNALQTQLPFELKQIYNFPVENHTDFEAFLHKKFKEKRLNGEWFSLNSKDIEYIKKEALLRQ